MDNREREEQIKNRIISTLVDAFEKGQVVRPETGGLSEDELDFLKGGAIDPKKERELEAKANASFEAEMKKRMAQMASD